MPPRKGWAAVYCRLSKENEDKAAAESESIRNQRALLLDWAATHGYHVYKVYTDEDYSGIDRARPGFNAMLNDARQGKFEVILAKTQSRFTRDMELVERYLHGLFPEWGVRFIAVLDHVDTCDPAGKKARQINGLINEWYLEDLSGNVRASLLILNEILGKGFDGQNIITGLAGHFRDLLVCRDESTLVLFEVGASIRERYKEMAKHCPDQLLFKAIELANTCDLNYRASRNKRLLLELTLIQLCQLTQVAVDDKKKALIEPIAGTNPSSQAVNSGKPQQPPQAPSVTAAAGAPQVMSTHMPSSVPAPPPSTAPNSVRRTARPMGISMKEIGVEKPKQQTVQQATTNVKEVVTPFDNDSLVREWDNYAATIDKKVYLKNTMINCKPTLQENYYFEVAVHNPGQQEELINNAIHILPFLRQHLNNSRIQMRVRIVEGNEKHLAYTSTEKLELLMKINPTLGRLRDEFNLTLD